MTPPIAPLIASLRTDYYVRDILLSTSPIAPNVTLEAIPTPTPTTNTAKDPTPAVRTPTATPTAIPPAIVSTFFQSTSYNTSLSFITTFFTAFHSLLKMEWPLGSI
jgi:hypothetical protein